MGENQAMWPMLLEKAWAKMKGTYTASEAGRSGDPLSAFVGCPVFAHFNLFDAEADSDTVWQSLYEADQLDYISTASSFGSSDQEVNEYGVRNNHVYQVISTFELLSSSGVPEHKMYMLRNPWSSTAYSGPWSKDDAQWTQDYIDQVPLGVDPRVANEQGIFIIEHDLFLRMFELFEIGHYRDGEGYTDDWYDKEMDYGEVNDFHVAIPAGSSGDLYFQVHSYHY
mmetsp:Transcript_14015/g.23811  ORF Transcript_14015/g.23811 Transcript_14015/m.23811 type:complete len:225 (+) Transcript_14015:520-1194(+)